MSIYIRCAVKNRTNEYLKNRIDHILDPKKTNKELILVRGVSKEKAYVHMMLIKRLFYKIHNRPYLHWILSFDSSVTTEAVYKVGTEVVDLIYYDYKLQVIAAIHCNTDNKHLHFIINATRYTDGEMFSEGTSGLYKFRTKLNKILVRNNIEKVGNINDYYGDDDDDMIDEKIKKVNSAIKDESTVKDIGCENKTLCLDNDKEEILSEKFIVECGGHEKGKLCADNVSEKIVKKEGKAYSKEIISKKGKLQDKCINNMNESKDNIILDTLTTEKERCIEDYIDSKYYLKELDSSYEEVLKTDQKEEEREDRERKKRKRIKTICDYKRMTDTMDYKNFDHSKLYPQGASCFREGLKNIDKPLPIFDETQYIRQENEYIIKAIERGYQQLRNQQEMPKRFMQCQINNIQERMKELEHQKQIYEQQLTEEDIY